MTQTIPLIDRLKVAVWMVGNMDTKEDQDQWWKNFGDLWEEIAEDACKICERELGARR